MLTTKTHSYLSDQENDLKSGAPALHALLNDLGIHFRFDYTYTYTFHCFGN